ncbi:MAG TPA: hypothetical protein VNG34_11590 [Actinomycetota bacterium]|nr:hypothetical protein [Actinomycetota bacterium]
MAGRDHPAAVLRLGDWDPGALGGDLVPLLVFTDFIGLAIPLAVVGPFASIVIALKS